MQKRMMLMMPLLVFVILAVMSAFALYNGKTDVTARGMKPMHMSVPGREVPLFKSNGFDTADLIGNVSVVVFFASWCPPCHVEHPFVEEIAAAGVPVYGINYKDTAAGLKSFFERHNNPYRAVAEDPEGQFAVNFGIVGVPASLIIDKKARVRYWHTMPITRRSLDQDLMPVIRELEQE